MVVLSRSWQREWGESSAASISLSVTGDRRRFSELALLACSVVIAPLIEIPFAPVSFGDPLKSNQEPLKEAGTFRIRANKAIHAPGASHLAIEGQSYASVKKISSHRCSTELN
ncbi:hypothetical protein L6452_09235 [Arctium lappa]|uniref:Uncharacterized protein n=1 Tax=Arctium lappa TaxID=4217 RepID=A0ACB9DJX7_ARCLA|nr:hypothetical protein L6452_09235 [Arctium lappa]